MAFELKILSKENILVLTHQDEAITRVITIAVDPTKISILQMDHVTGKAIGGQVASFSENNNFVLAQPVPPAKMAPQVATQEVFDPVTLDSNLTDATPTDAGATA